MVLIWSGNENRKKRTHFDQNCAKYESKERARVNQHLLYTLLFILSPIVRHAKKANVFLICTSTSRYLLNNVIFLLLLSSFYIFFVIRMKQSRVIIALHGLVQPGCIVIVESMRLSIDYIIFFFVRIAMDTSANRTEP